LNFGPQKLGAGGTALFLVSGPKPS
jgi:hypothetical protein